MMAEPLKPCPFCGSDRAKPNEQDDNRGGYWWVIDCYGDDCGGTMDGLFATEAEAIAAWNRRVPGVVEGGADG